MSSRRASFAGRIVAWQRKHGRHSLPWQNTRDPYRVWLSEIMLQQTQVATVLDYYARFLARFPDVRTLAAASVDEVLGLWSGLGYYSRARNMHRCAQNIVSVYAGEFPRSAQELQTLPGIGRSTAAAIASLCFGERVAILDGNAKRVLTRFLGYGGDLAIASNERILWEHAQAQLPRHSVQESMPRYTQGLMDLGATVCLARNPSCLLCPVRELCVACSQGMPQSYPVKTRKPKRGVQALWLLWARARDGSIWLEKRPLTGIWAGLHCMPAFASREALLAAAIKRRGVELHDEATVVHGLTHKDLHLHPVTVQLTKGWSPAVDGAWFGREEWPRLGLPAPIRRLLAGH